jgi:transcriptional regulator with XRE-family HTH domain
MHGLGEKLRQRARELGLTDTEVARRLGLSQARYANYVNDKREPDFRTFTDICRILSVSPNRLLGVSDQVGPSGLKDPAAAFEGPATGPEAEERVLLRDRLLSAAEAMTIPTLETAVAISETLLKRQAEES